MPTAGQRRSVIMRAMQTLRTARFIARLVLACFVLSLGVAIASPLVNPQSMELVCASGGAMKLIVKNADGGADEVRGHTLDCPMCLPLGAPLPQVQSVPVVPSALAHALRPLVAAHIAGRSAAALPPRGPPTNS